MNLLSTSWLKIKRQSGVIETIAPYQITENYQTDPVIDLILPRSDFRGAIIQFLIGLLQTAFADIQPYQWRTWRKNPPSPEELKMKFAPFIKAFAIDSNGPSFMQDLELTGAEFKPIGSLLLEQPGENTLKNTTDHFIKRAQVNALCPICAITALLTLQINAPSGGAGHRTSIRGGGPLTTLVMEKPLNNRLPTLWQNLWLNVRADVQKYKILANEPLHKIFPWLMPTRTSEAKTGADTTIEDVHPLQMFWAMPRRIRLNYTTTLSGHCDLCGIWHEQLLTQYQTKNYGINYTGTWKHPLSPYSQKADGEWLPMHPQPGGIGYKHWLSLTLGINGKTNKKPAAVVADCIYQKGRKQPDEPLQLWAFGYDLDKMKVRCWYESHLPFDHIPAKYRSEFQEAVGKLLEAADLALSYARSMLKKANGDISRLELRFWTETEQDFYQFLTRLSEAIEADQELTPIYEQWHSMLIKKAQALFKQIAIADVMRNAKFYNELTKYLQGKKLRSVLGLAILSKKETKNAING